MKRTLPPLRALLVSASLFLFVPDSPARASWEPVPEADRLATTCVSFPGSNAEALFIRLTLVGSGSGNRSDYYKRIKIYSAQGVDELGVLAIERSDSQRVWDYGARVVKPDGRIQEYGKDSFHDTVVAKVGRQKFNRLALAVPDLTAGDIVEMRWTSSIESGGFSHYWWYGQLEIPVRSYTMKAVDLDRDYVTMWFNLPAKSKGKGGSFDLQMNDIPPWLDEPYTPAVRDVRGWFMIAFRDVEMRWYRKGNDFLKEISTYWAEEFRLRTKPDGTVTAKAKALIAGVTEPGEKLRRLYDFCQENIGNISYQVSDKLIALDKKLGSERSQSPRETLAREGGDPDHINDLFAALARAAGFEVCEGHAASRAGTLNVRNPDGWMFLNDQQVFVKLGTEWRPYAPGDYGIPAGFMHPFNQGVSSLRAVTEQVVFETTPSGRVDDSLQTRVGKFSVDAEGNLSGDVEITLTGYPAIMAKRDNYGKQLAETEKSYREDITNALPTAEVTDLVWENLGGLKYPVIVRYKLKVPAYAEFAGSNLVLPLNPFEHDRPAVFTAEKRIAPIHFPYAHKEHDEIEIVIPTGYRLEAPSLPPPVGNIAQDIGVAYHVSYVGSTRTIKYRRDYALGATGALDFNAGGYPAIKNRFDRIRRSDEHTLILAESVATPTVPAAAPEGSEVKAGGAP